MRNRLMILFLLLFSFSLFAQNPTTVWAPGGESDGLWTTGANWSAGLPGDTSKVVFNVPTAMECTLDATASIWKLVHGDGANGGVLRIANNGDLTTSNTWSGVGWSDTAKVIVETGGTLTFGEHMWVGFEPGSNGTVQLDGGTINVTNMFGINFEGKGGKGAVHVNSGTLNLAEFSATQSLRGPADSASIDISEGSVVITGDLSGAVNDYIASGNITAYGGTGTVVVEVVEGNTVVTAIDGVPITFGNELIFDGDNDYVDVGNGDPVNISGSELTLEAWIYATGWRDNVWQGCIINTESAPNNGYMIRAGANGTVNFNVGNSGWNEINTAEATLQLDKWHHIAATFNAGVMTIYVDGVQAATADSSASTTTVGVATTNTAIGNWGNFANPGRSFLGTVHDVRIWNVARSAEQIAANKDIELSGSEEGLAGYWQMNEGTGQTVADLTGNQDGQLGSTDGQDENDPRWKGEVIIPPLEVQPKDFLVFDGTSQYVDLGNPAALDITGSAITIEALI
ncbi:MAG: LamG domain-containing protein, partial [Gammaproteobacteria bacterium]|nr:LamG domain-containing protein [Gammaproteobacteria bacterium]